MPLVSGRNQWHFTLYNFITLQKLIIQKHEVIVHYVICFSTALDHSYTRQPLPCLDRKEPTPLCLSALPFITHWFFFFFLKPFTGALPRKMVASTWLWLWEISLSQLSMMNVWLVTVTVFFSLFLWHISFWTSKCCFIQHFLWEYVGVRLFVICVWLFFTWNTEILYRVSWPLGHSCDTNETSTH